MTEGKGGRRALGAARTRAAILEGARGLFSSQGFDATAITDIGASAQAGKGTVYHHFADKKEIFAEVFVAVQSSIMAAAVEAMAEDGSAWERLERGTRRFLRGYTADPQARAILRQALGVLGWDRVRELDQATALPLIRAGLEQFVEAGEIAPVPSEVAAELVFGLFCNAVLILATTDRGDAGADDVEAVVLTLLRGLRTARP